MCREKWNHVAGIGKSTRKSSIVVTSSAEKEAVIVRDIISTNENQGDLGCSPTEPRGVV